MRLIDADALKANFEANTPAFAQDMVPGICYIIDRARTIDAVQVVRCKDCKWYGRADKRRFYRGMDCLQKRIGSIVPERDFCSRGERKES